MGVLSLLHESGTIDVPDSALIVGVDDTGNDLFSDKQHPVFGLGGCAVLARDYFAYLDDPWRGLKEHYFGGRDVKLHASDMKNPTNEQLAALESFFTSFPFFRFAAMAANTLDNETDETNLHLVSFMALQQIAECSRWVQPTEIVFIIENSQRIERDLLKHFSAYKFGNRDIEITPRAMLASKEVRGAPVEVADFVMQAAGAQVRNRLRGFASGQNVIRKDFEAVFHNVDSRLSSYIELLGAKPVASRAECD